MACLIQANGVTRLNIYKYKGQGEFVIEMFCYSLVGSTIMVPIMFDVIS